MPQRPTVTIVVPTGGGPRPSPLPFPAARSTLGQRVPPGLATSEWMRRLAIRRWTSVWFLGCALVLVTALPPSALAQRLPQVHGAKTYRGIVRNPNMLALSFGFSVLRRARITATLRNTGPNNPRCDGGFYGEFEHPDTFPVSTSSSPQTSTVTPGETVHLRLRLRPGRYLLGLGEFSCTPVHYSFALSPASAIRR